MVQNIVIYHKIYCGGINLKDLPKVFANKISDNIDNTQDLFYGSDRIIEKKKNSINIIKKINDIFASSTHVYKSNVKVTLKDEIVEKVIVGKTNTHLITIEGEYIRIIDIEDIEKI